MSRVSSLLLAVVNIQTSSASCIPRIMACSSSWKSSLRVLTLNSTLSRTARDYGYLFCVLHHGIPFVRLLKITCSRWDRNLLCLEYPQKHRVLLIVAIICIYVLSYTVRGYEYLLNAYFAQCTFFVPRIPLSLAGRRWDRNQLCLKYPQKHRVLVGFLATFLREEGGFEFKKAITDCIVELMSAIPDTKVCSF